MLWGGNPTNSGTLTMELMNLEGDGLHFTECIQEETRQLSIWAAFFYIPVNKRELDWIAEMRISIIC